MIWGSISGNGKGPMVVWRKEWGNITADSYIKHIIPQILVDLEDHPELQVMEDNAPSHKAAKTQRYWGLFEVFPMEWPPCSPDLNPIENVWREIKRLIRNMEKLPRTVEEMQEAFRWAWDQVTDDYVISLVNTMPERMAAVIAASGGHTKW